MARRNNFLVVVLLVSVGLLVGGVVLFGGRQPAAPPGVDPAAAGPTGGAAGDPGVAVGRVEPDERTSQGAVDPGARREVDTPAAPAATRVLLRGRLLDPSGGPAAGVGLGWQERTQLGGVDVMPRSDVAVDATSGTDGRFAIEVDAATRGYLRLARASNLLFAPEHRRSLEFPAHAADADLGDLVVRPGGRIVGQVVGDDGAGLPAARVRANQGTFALWIPGQGQSVDGDGRFELLGLEPGSHRIGAEAAGFVPGTATVDVDLDGAAAEVRIALSRGASIAGTIVDDRGVPIAGARVAPVRRQSMAPTIEVQAVDASGGVETDQNGYFVLSGLDGTAAAVRASAKGHRARTTAEVAVGTGNVRIELPRLGEVSGVLLDAADGQPIAGSRVTARAATQRVVGRGDGPQLDFGDQASAETDAEGRFTITGVAPGTVALSARGDGHLPVEGFAVQVAAGGTVANVALRAETGARIDARVVDADGAPVAGARVVVRERPDARPQPGGARRVSMRVERDDTGGPGGDIVRSFGEPSALRSGTTDDEGRVVLAGLPAGPVQVLAESDAAAPSRPADVAVPRRGTVETWLTLRPAGHVGVRVVDASGQPLADVAFALHGPQGADEQDRATESGTTDASGLARVGPLLEGRWTAVLRLPPKPMSFGGGMSFVVAGSEGDELAGTQKELVVRAGETTDVELVRPILTRVTGVVRDAAGLAADVEVELRDPDAPPLGAGWTTQTDRDGRFALADVPAGTYRIEWGRTTQVVPHRDEIVVPAGVPEVVRDLELRGGRVRVAVRSDADDLPLVGAQVTLRRAGDGAARGSRMMMVSTVVTQDSDDDAPTGASSITMGGAPVVRTDDAGVALIEDVPPGEAVVVVTHRRHAEGRVEDVTVTDGGTADAGTVTLATAGVIRGRVLDMPGGELEVALVECRRAGSDEPPRVEGAMGGSFQIDSLAAGDYELRARLAGAGGDEQFGPVEKVTVRAGEPSRIELRLPAR